MESNEQRPSAQSCINHIQLWQKSGSNPVIFSGYNCHVLPCFIIPFNPVFFLFFFGIPRSWIMNDYGNPQY